MTKDKLFIYDHNTGEQIERQMTDEEQAERDAQVAAWLAQEAAKIAETQALEEAKTAAQAKLTALGLTTEDLQALGLGGN